MTLTSQSDLVENLDAIVARWRLAVRGGADHRPRVGARGRAERVLAAALVRAALSPVGDRWALAELRRAADAYAALPRVQPPAPGAVYTELAGLRDAVFFAMRDRFGPGEPRMRFLMDLDRVAMLALRTMRLREGMLPPEGPPSAPVGDRAS